MCTHYSPHMHVIFAHTYLEKLGKVFALDVIVSLDKDLTQATLT